MKNAALIVAAILFSVTVFAQTKPASKSKPVTILIETEYGNMTAVLYDDTPQHRDNFVKLVKQGWYNGSIFHRVINKFMIQGGGQETKVNDPGYTIPAEFVPAHFHKKGALAAARKGDQVNPKKASSGSQFYIVQGTVLNNQQLDIFRKTKPARKYRQKDAKYITPSVGTPHLDDDYTVFGEVIKGLEVIDKIAAAQTGAGDRPVKDIKMKITIVK